MTRVEGQTLKRGNQPEQAGAIKGSQNSTASAVSDPRPQLGQDPGIKGRALRIPQVTEAQGFDDVFNGPRSKARLKL